MHLTDDYTAQFVRNTLGGGLFQELDDKIHGHVR